MKDLKKIAITGGKGGVGKSTVAVLKAEQFVKRKKRIILCDCDVECPNDYLLLGERLKKPRKYIYNEYPKLLKTKCKKCGLCVRNCKNNAIFQAPGKFPVFIKDLCSSCGACWMVCPNNAIKRKKEKVGQIFVNKVRNNFWLITGLSNPGIEETGPIVLRTKEFALDFAKKQKADIILFDTAPGTHCPVISALLNCDLAMIITEPTPMGAHDLGLILRLCEKLKIPSKIILNQADLGDKREVISVLRKFKTKIEEEIPYSRELAESYSKGRLLNIEKF